MHEYYCYEIMTQILHTTFCQASVPSCISDTSNAPGRNKFIGCVNSLINCKMWKLNFKQEKKMLNLKSSGKKVISRISQKIEEAGG